jgi:hypothetical protein
MKVSFDIGISFKYLDSSLVGMFLKTQEATHKEPNGRSVDLVRLRTKTTEFVLFSMESVTAVSAHKYLTDKQAHKKCTNKGSSIHLQSISKQGTPKKVKYIGYLRENVRP